MKDRLVIGVGNEFRQDDAAGIVIARELHKRGIAGLEIVEASGEGGGLIELFRNRESVVIVDAVRSGAEPGTLFEIDAHRDEIPTGLFNYSTHAFSVAEAVELARTLDALPAALMLFGIEGRDFGHGTDLSPPVADAVPNVVERVEKYYA
jgi:hydrogenase maturation protease